MSEVNGRAVLVSACLGGIPCKYNGTSAGPVRGPLQENLLLVCPESSGGLPTPRPRAEIVGGDGFDVLDGRARVMTHVGEDVTSEYLRGAHETLAVAQRSGAEWAILQEYSPACGRTMVSDGSFMRNRVEGVGVTTALLLRNGIQVKGFTGTIDSVTNPDGGIDLDNI